MHTRLVRDFELKQRTRRVCEDISQICNAGKAFTRTGYHRDPVQTLLLRKESSIDRMITPIIESSAIQAEKMAAGAGEIFLNLFHSGMTDEIRRSTIGVESDKEWEEIQKKIQTHSIPVRKSDFENLVFSDGSCHSSIMKKIVDSLRANDNVFVRKSPTLNTSIERDVGYSFFNLGINQKFTERGNWTRNRPRVFLIDGIVEKISEIHVFLEEASREKTPAIIFCLDALPEIYETLIKNFSLGNLDVLIASIPVDETSINTVKDLGVIFGVEPIAAGTGETIGLGMKRQRVFVDKVTVTRGKISIENASTRSNVISHVYELRKRIEENIDLAQILEPRIKNLSSSTIRVSVGLEDQKRDPGIIEKLDRSLRMLPKTLKFGFIEKKDFQGFSSSKIDLLFRENHVVSAETAYQAIKIFLSTRESIKSAGAGIEAV